MRDGSDDTRTVPSGVEDLDQAGARQRDRAVDLGRKHLCGERVCIAITHDRRRRHVLGDGDHPLPAHVPELPRRLRHRDRGHRNQHHRNHQQLEHQELAGQAAEACGSVT